MWTRMPSNKLNLNFTSSQILGRIKLNFIFRIQCYFLSKIDYHYSKRMNPNNNTLLCSICASPAEKQCSDGSIYCEKCVQKLKNCPSSSEKVSEKTLQSQLDQVQVCIIIFRG